MRKKCGFAHVLVLFLESQETPLFVQINVFAVRALRLDRKNTQVYHVDPPKAHLAWLLVKLIERLLPVTLLS